MNISEVSMKRPKKKEQISSSSSSNDSSESEDAPYKETSAKHSSNIQDSVYEERNQETISESFPKDSSLQTSTSKLESYFETYKNFTKLQLKTDVPLPKISKSAIYLMQIPKGLNHQALINQEISLIDKTKLKLDGEKYLFTPLTEDPQTLSLLTSVNKEYCIKKGLLCGSIKVQRHFKHKNSRDVLDTSTNKVGFPAEIKVRHPIFGDNYIEEIELDKSIQDKLNDSTFQFNEQVKKKKKKKKRDDKETELKDEMIFQILENAKCSSFLSEDLPKKKRKRKHKDKESSSSSKIMYNEALENSEEETSHKKQKMDDSLIITEENLLSTDVSARFHTDKRKKDKKIKSLHISFTDTPTELFDSDNIMKTLGTASTSFDLLNKLSKEEKKHADLKNNTKAIKTVNLNADINSLIDKYCSSIEDDTSENPKKKKKKKSKDKYANEATFNEKSPIEDGGTANTSKVKKRKRNNCSISEMPVKNKSKSNEQDKNTANALEDKESSSLSRQIIYNGTLLEDSEPNYSASRKKQKPDGTLISAEESLLSADTSAPVHKDKRKKDKKIKILQNVLLADTSAELFDSNVMKTVSKDNVDNAGTSFDSSNKLSKKQKKDSDTKGINLSANINSLIDKYSSSMEDDTSESPKKKKKKKNKKNKEKCETEDTVNEKLILTEDDGTADTSKKKKRKNKDREVESESDEDQDKNIMNDILRDIGLSLGITKKKKKGSK